MRGLVVSFLFRSFYVVHTNTHNWCVCYLKQNLFNSKALTSFITTMTEACINNKIAKTSEEVQTDIAIPYDWIISIILYLPLDEI